MTTEQRLALFPHTTEIDTGGALRVAGLRLAELAAQHGTPLYVYDAATLHHRLRAYRTALAAWPGLSGVTCAGKAALNTALAQWVRAQAAWLDCTGTGELGIAAAAGLPQTQTLVHGVNKSPADLQRAVAQAGVIVVDNLHELAALAALTAPLPYLWLRLRPGQLVNTHHHVQTGQDTSKFGLGPDEWLEAAQFCHAHRLPLRGIHFHLGSQFRDAAPLEAAIHTALDVVARAGLPSDWAFSPGGGLGVPYHEDDLPHPDIAGFVGRIIAALKQGCGDRGLPLPRLQLEPGRSLVAQAGVAIYRVGGTKHSGGRRWLLLDGGLADNPRYALYSARYTALPCTNAAAPLAAPAWLGGPCCESGDVLIADLPLPDVEAGTYIAIPMSGAYQLSMASNYNGAGRPAVLWLDDGAATLIQRRERPTDLTARDLPLPGQGSAAIAACKYHALGNDYLVVRAADLSVPFTASHARALCDRRTGPGADGVLLAERRTGHLRIFKPDGSQAEKSGNGLRIFTRYLYDEGLIGHAPVTLTLPAATATAQIHADLSVTVTMSVPQFDARTRLALVDRQLDVTVLNIGNPHCVVPVDAPTRGLAETLGPQIETHAAFPNRTNVQFARVIDRHTVQIEIWERGAGYTLASGSSACAAAAATHRHGQTDYPVTVQMPGGTLHIARRDDGELLLTGPVSPVWRGTVAGAVFAQSPA